MLRKVILIFLVVFPLQGISSSIDAQETARANCKDARTIFLKGTSLLVQVGGIASLEVPEGLDPFPKDSTRGMSAKEIEQLVREAVTYLRRSLEIDPSLHEAYYYLGAAYTRILMVDEAIEAFQKSMQFEPDRILTYNLLCTLLLEKGRYGEALKVGHNFLHRFPTKPALGNTLIGMAYYESGDYEQAIKIGKEIVLLDGKNVSGHLLLATSYYMLDRYDESEIEFKKVVEIDPGMAVEIGKIREGLRNKSEQAPGK